MNHRFRFTESGLRPSARHCGPGHRRNGSTDNRPARTTAGPTIASPAAFRTVLAAGARTAAGGFRGVVAGAALVAIASCARGPGQVPQPPAEPVVEPGRPLRALETDVRDRIARESAGTIAVSFIDLETGRRFGINDDIAMHAASTMKVPVLIEIFRQAEQGRYALDDSITVRNTFHSIADSSTYSLKASDDSDSTLYQRVGGRATIRELARLMTVRSSNLATNILIELATASAVRETLARANVTGMNVQRGVEDTPAFERGMNNTTSAAGLAGSLEMIARCSVTSRASCDAMIDILAAQEFNEMIPAGVPRGTRVAHKTGWITRIQHDGAIVYPPGRAPYILVVLTQGFDDRAAAVRAGADISRIVWEHVMGNRLAWTADTLPFLDLYQRYRNPTIGTRRFPQELLHRAIAPYRDAFAIERVGNSAEGRPLDLYRFGSGPTTVLLWSQMHGDESTATMALTDLMKYMATADDERTRDWRNRLTILLLPMLNPDGAARFRRHNAYGIDINRDARNLATPEGRALKSVRDRYRPAFGFNLHDQNPRTRVGRTSRHAAISLLAPPKNAEGVDDEQTLRAKRLAAHIRRTITPYVGGHITRYDDSFNPRAFGDNMQIWGTTTVLIESGGWRDDPEKQYLRAVNFAALIGALDAIADGSYEQTPLSLYESLPPNGSSTRELIIIGGTVVIPGLEPFRGDVAADVSGTPARLNIVEIGDLQGVEARDTIAAEGLFLHAPRGTSALTIGTPLEFTLRVSADSGSRVVRRLRGP